MSKQVLRRHCVIVILSLFYVFVIIINSFIFNKVKFSKQILKHNKDFMRHLQMAYMINVKDL